MFQIAAWRHHFKTHRQWMSLLNLEYLQAASAYVFGGHLEPKHLPLLQCCDSRKTFLSRLSVTMWPWIWFQGRDKLTSYLCEWHTTCHHCTSIAPPCYGQGLLIIYYTLVWWLHTLHTNARGKSDTKHTTHLVWHTTHLTHQCRGQSWSVGILSTLSHTVYG